MRQRRFRYGSEDLYLVRLSYILGAMYRQKGDYFGKDQCKLFEVAGKLSVLGNRKKGAGIL